MDSYDRCSRIVSTIENILLFDKELSKSISFYDIQQLQVSCAMFLHCDIEDGDSWVRQPMVWIGIYIAIASFFCILAMAVDLLHGFRNKKFWFPCNYFSLNAASLTVIAVTMKLPVDITSGTSSFWDQGSKVGSLAFMCTMMANLMPSLASMDNKTLVANVIGLCILVITVVVNICIQIITDGIFYFHLEFRTTLFFGLDFLIIAYIYVAIILVLLIITISSSLTISTYKETLEFKYQAKNKLISLTDQGVQRQGSLIEKLRQHVRRYWVMADTGSPQFVMANNPLSTACGVICVIVLVIDTLMVLAIQLWLRRIQITDLTGSPYKWSTHAICVTQYIGVLVGTIAPISRCFSIFSFKLSNKWNTNYFMVLKVDKYYTQKLNAWKQSPMPFLSSRIRSRSLICNSKDMILSICIGFQKVVVVSCKVLWLILVGNYLYCWESLKARWFTPSLVSRTDDSDDDLSNYVLRVDNEMELDEKTLKGISNSMNSLILKATKEQNNNLLELINKSSGLKGVEIFDTDHVQSLLSVELVNSWSLPIVTLTCIAIALPNIPKDTVDRLLTSVSEGLSFTHLVEESLNSESEYVSIQKTSKIVWYEVEYKCKWLNNRLAKNVFKGKTTTEIIEWFSDKAKEILTTEINESTNGDLIDNPSKMLIAANSMYRITQTILLRLQSNIEPITKKKLFAHLNCMIADIFSACFTNIPRVIRMRCQESVIEKREASVKVAANLLGKTTKIIERLETLQLPSLDDEKMAYIDEWRLYLKQSIP